MPSPAGHVRPYQRAAFFLLLSLLAEAAAAQPRLVAPATSVDLGTVRPGQPAHRVVLLKNVGSDAVRLLGIQLSRGLVLARGPATIPPGGEVGLSLGLDTDHVVGDYRGTVVVNTTDPFHRELTLHVTARVVPNVEVRPRPAVFVVGQRGASKEVAVEVVNRDVAPLEVVSVEHPTERFTTRLDTVEAGQRYRLTVVLRPDGPGGRHTDAIVVHTTSPTQPTVRIAANTHLRESVYTFPDEVDLGALSVGELRDTPGLAARLAQTLMVYQPGGGDFLATFESDLSFLAVAAERGSKGDRWQATLTLDPSKLATGPVRGSVIITTNDPKVPVLRVPVTGEFR